MYISALLAVSVNWRTTPDSLKRLPNISIPTRGVVEGRIEQTIMVTMIGNRILSVFDTGRSCPILIERSSLVVSAFMIGG